MKFDKQGVNTPINTVNTAIEKLKNFGKNCLEIKQIKLDIINEQMHPAIYKTFKFIPKILNRAALSKYEKGP